MATNSTCGEQQFCRDHLAWAERYLAARLGPHAGEYAGLGLIRAYRTFDPSRGVPFSAWLRKQLYWTARDEVKRFHARPGTARYRAQRERLPLQDNDLTTTGDTVGASLTGWDRFFHLLRIAECDSYWACMAARAKLLAALTDRDVQATLGLSRDEINEACRLVQESG